MPYISQIQLPSDNQPYILKDKEAFGDASFSNSTLTLKRRDYDSTNSNTYLNINLSDIMAANDAMVFKGTIGSGTPGTLPTTNYAIGDTYRVTVAGTYAGQTCEVGDLIIAINDYVQGSASNNDWTIAQTNIDGAVTTSGGADGYLVKFTDSHIIANGPQLGSSTTTYLNNAGQWTTPATVSHTHGNIAYNGTITSTGVALSSNDRLLFSDNSNSGKIERTSIVFDGSTTTQALTPKGTWETFLTEHYSAYLYAGGETDTDNGTTTTGNTHLLLVENSTLRSKVKLIPAGGLSITSDNSGNITFTQADKKLEIGTVTSGTTYYPIVATNSTGAATRQYDTNFIYKSTNGSSSATGTSILTLGNNASKTSASREGQIVIYGTGTVATTIKVKATSTARTINFPDADGDILVGTFSAGTTPVTFSVSNEILTIASGTAPSIS